MARMIPTTLDSNSSYVTTAGERKLFSILKRMLPETCLVRYEVIIGERDFRPDFIITDPARGILIIEVKDWGVDKIEEATPQLFLVRGLGGSSHAKPQKNPDLKCQHYLRFSREQMIAMPNLQDDYGRLDLQVDYALAFPNISRQEFEDEGFQEVLPHNVLLREDLLNNGRPFLERYHQFMPELKSSISQARQEGITAALCPDVKIPVKSGLEVASKTKVQKEKYAHGWYTLSLDQEEVAKSLGKGHRLLRGIAGTGKTLIMLYRAKLLAANDSTMRVLVLCWNTSLANYMRQLFDVISIEIDDQAKQAVEIMHFTDFIRELSAKYQGDWHDFDSPDFDFWLRQIRISSKDQYDAVYVDEAQDFRREWIEFIYNKMIMGEIGERDLLVSADDAQRIYSSRDFHWSDLDLPSGITARGRSRILKTIYRNSARVWMFSAFLQPDRAAYMQEGEDKVQFSNKGGYDPVLTECANLSEQIDKVAKIIKMMRDKSFRYRNVLVLYRHKNFQGYPIVERLRNRLRKEGIPHEWISESPEAKRNFDWQADTVKISTVHSSKGMDSPVVIVLGAETFQTFGNHDYDEVRLMYVALTRAREVLFVLYSGHDGLVPELDSCMKQYIDYRPAIIQLEEAT